MFVNVGDISYKVREFGNINASNILVALHGFTGSGQIYEQYSQRLKSEDFRLLAVDSPGHGSTNTPNSAHFHTFDAQLNNFTALIDQLNIPIFHLLGYSMGGRIALHYAINHSYKLASLTLESTNNGISNEVERLDRVSRDHILSDELILNYPHFLKKWNRLPLFQSPRFADNTQLESFNTIQAKQDPIQMALSLREFSPGKIPYVNDELRLISCPVLAITGNMDHKYNDLWTKLINIFKNGIHVSIKNAGHRVHLDQPAEYIDTVLNFIKSTIK